MFAEMKNDMKKLLQFITITILAFIVACNQPDTVVSTVVVTEIVESEQTAVIVTRIVEQVVTTTPVAPQNNQQTVEPVKLDISILGSTVPILNPQLNQSDDGINLIENLFVGLTRLNPATQQIEPYLAESWESSSDGREWTFNLRNDIHWVKPNEQEDDGNWSVEELDLVDANDVVFTIQRACQRETQLPDVVMLFIIQGCEEVYSLNEASTADLAQIGVVALDDRTVKFTLTKPSSYFLTISSLWYLRPLPKTLIEQMEAEELVELWTDPENLITSGPFFPIPNRQSLQKNPSWPIPFEGNVDIINYYLVSEENAQQLWEAKRIDYIPYNGSIEDDLYAENEKEQQLIPEQTLFYLGFNFNSGVFREPTVRLAFSAAIDRQLLVDELYLGQAFGMKHLVPPGVVGALPVADIGMGYDPDYARVQMAQSGFGSCRLMPPIRFLVNSSDLSLLQAELIREMWVEELGCAEEQIIIEQAQFGTLLANTRVGAGNFRPDIWELGWASFYPDAHSWMGELIHCAESENRADRPCSEVDDLIRSASSEADFEARLLAYREIESDLFSQGGLIPLVPLYVTGQNYLVHTWMKSELSNFGGQQFDRIFIDSTLKRLEQSRN